MQRDCYGGRLDAYCTGQRHNSGVSPSAAQPQASLNSLGGAHGLNTTRPPDGATSNPVHSRSRGYWPRQQPFHPAHASASVLCVSPIMAAPGYQGPWSCVQDGSEPKRKHDKGREHEEPDDPGSREQHAMSGSHKPHTDPPGVCLCRVPVLQIFKTLLAQHNEHT